jgi:uroporphyrin-III C-methyltransferase/precorrin-2 dehydrogenase/sirohydrochlorin ferrochelatase
VSANEIRVFPVALNLRERAVLVVGGGAEADLKVPKLLAAGARVTIVAPVLAEPLARAARTRALTWFARDFVPTDVQGAHLVMLTEVDPLRAAELRALATTARFWLCAIDQPAYTDFYLVSTLERGPVQIAISTGGFAPLLARRLREGLERGLDRHFGEFARSFADLRASLRALPKPERMRRLTRALDGFAMDVRLRYPEPDGQGAGHPKEPARDEQDPAPKST